ncbi:hypothetical protein DFH08DRAFT_228899 [Mycena albidolilacea]|uniref:Uncharacterized protein n=1 Tax=Mycena albidolilacea TaxID=1033008 RepID=A0AAD6ZYF0_9AGAR|nr:hypothetical protein DFH08DRAFT_228899 [Mycena albidolilacea]
MLTPISLNSQKRLSLIVHPYDPPSPVSPIFDLLTPVPYSPSPYSPDASPSSSPSPIRLTQQPFSSSPTSLSQPMDTPARRTSRPPKMRPKSYGGGLTPATLELILDFESRIAELESRHTRISVELEETRDALNSERAKRRSSNRFSTLSHARFSSISSSSHDSDGPGSEQNDADYERRLRDELQDTLKKIRAQNALISRSLRQKEETCVSLSTTLEEERSARKAADEEVTRLTAANFTLLEHNKLLVGRDAALQEDISALVTKSQADEWMRGVLETELHRRGPPSSESTYEPHPEPERPTLTLEHQGNLRAELVSTRDELHITQVRLATSERERTTLTQRVSALQKQLVMCLDSSSQALDVERELRADVEERSRGLADENATLKTRLTSLEEVFPDGQAPGAWIKLKRSSLASSSGSEAETKRRPGRLQKKIESNLKLDTVDRLLDRHRHVLNSKKIRAHKKRRLSMAKLPKRDVLATPTLQTFTLSWNNKTQPPMSPESTCSTKVASPGPSPLSTSKRNKRMSVILAATLSKDSRPTWSALKTHSSLFVDVNNRLDEPMVKLETVMASPPRPAKRPRPQDLRTYVMQRASAMFVDFAHSYTSVETVPESSDENLV